jgi:hypothetical protein
MLPCNVSASRCQEDVRLLSASVLGSRDPSYNSQGPKENSELAEVIRFGFQRRTFLFLWVPELSPAPATSFSQQQSTTTEPKQFSNSLTHQPTQLTHCPRHGASRKHRSSVAVKLLPWKHACLLSRYLATDVVQLFISLSLPSNGSTCHNMHE